MPSRRATHSPSFGPFAACGACGLVTSIAAMGTSFAAPPSAAGAASSATASSAAASSTTTATSAGPAPLATPAASSAGSNDAPSSPPPTAPSSGSEPTQASAEERATARSAADASNTSLALDDAAAEGRAVALSWLQYGAAFVFESRAAPGGVCPSRATVPCIMGSGGGVGLRLGTRREQIWYFGGAYQFTKHDSSNLLRLPILQQLKAEARRYFDEGTRVAPYMLGQIGAALYGGEWRVDTYGALIGVGAGVEFQFSREATIGLTTAYREMYFDGWVDRAGQPRNGGLAHFIGLEITLEARGRFKRAEP